MAEGQRSKRDRFLDLAEPRMKRVEDALRSLGELGNPRRFDSEADELAELRKWLVNACEAAVSSLQPSVRQTGLFRRPTAVAAAEEGVVPLRPAEKAPAA